MPNNDPTICAKCKHVLLPGTVVSPGVPCCEISPGLNFVTGALEHQPCALKNNAGHCADYAPAPVPHDDQADEAYGSSDTDEGVTGDG
jgi:hypothetical protein